MGILGQGRAQIFPKRQTLVETMRRRAARFQLLAYFVAQWVRRLNRNYADSRLGFPRLLGRDGKVSITYGHFTDHGAL